MSESSRQHYAFESSNERYLHKFHAGNIGDVWKHVVLGALFQDFLATSSSCTFFETHAGAGTYQLASTGEWSEGVGALLVKNPSPKSKLLRDYIEKITARGFKPSGKCTYPGSPILAADSLRISDTLNLWELEPDTCDQLHSALEGNPIKLSITQGDGMAALEQFVEKMDSNTNLLVHIDPPWGEKQDWQRIPKLLVKIARQAPRACIALWYPIKSYTRVNAMLNFLKVEQLNFVAADLITAPLDQRKNRLNGSGMLLIGINRSILPEIAAVGVEIGATCGLNGFWDLRLSERGV